jgi:hypothetical protein
MALFREARSGDFEDVLRLYRQLQPDDPILRDESDAMDCPPASSLPTQPRVACPAGAHQPDARTDLASHRRSHRTTAASASSTNLGPAAAPAPQSEPLRGHHLTQRRVHRPQLGDEPAQLVHGGLRRGGHKPNDPVVQIQDQLGRSVSNPNQTPAWARRPPLGHGRRFCNRYLLRHDKPGPAHIRR